MDKIILKIKVIAPAKREDIIDIGNNNFKIKLTSIPQRGEANKKLIEILAAYYNIKRRNIEIISGIKSRNKKIIINFRK